MNPRSSPKQPTSRRPKVSLLYGGGWSFVSHRLYLWGLEGWEWDTTLSLVGARMAIGQCVKAVAFHNKVNASKRINDSTKNQSYWATKDEVEKCHFLSGKQGVFLGRLLLGQTRSRDVLYDGEANISNIGSPGEGKNTSLVIPSLLAKPNHSVCTNDLKGECLAITKTAPEGKDRFFIDDSRSLSAFIALTSLRHQEEPTLSSMHKQVMQRKYLSRDLPNPKFPKALLSTETEP